MAQKCILIIVSTQSHMYQKFLSSYAATHCSKINKSLANFTLHSFHFLSVFNGSIFQGIISDDQIAPSFVKIYSKIPYKPLFLHYFFTAFMWLTLKAWLHVWPHMGTNFLWQIQNVFILLQKISNLYISPSDGDSSVQIFNIFYPATKLPK